MNAPLTWKKHGSTRCVECSRLFVDGDDIVENLGSELTGGRIGTYLPTNRVEVRRRWHRACLETVEAFIAKVRDDEVDNRAAMIADIAATMSPAKADEQLAKMEPDFAARVRQHMKASA